MIIFSISPTIFSFCYTFCCQFSIFQTLANGQSRKKRQSLSLESTAISKPDLDQNKTRVTWILTPSSGGEESTTQSLRKKRHSLDSNADNLSLNYNGMF